jgi:hypothetical protein
MEPIPEAGLEMPISESASIVNEVPQACLNLCLERLPLARKTLLIRYYQSEKRAKIDGRQILAEELGIGTNALRIQVFRLRRSLRQCVEGCKTRKEMKRSFLT